MDPSIAVRAGFKSARCSRIAVRSARLSSIKPPARIVNVSNSSRARKPLPLTPCHNDRWLQVPKITISPQRRLSSDDASTSVGGLNYTALHELHVEHGGKMVPFGGFSMPVQYSDLSVGESHKWTREKASLFDVGHMYALLLSVQDTVIEHCPIGSNIISPVLVPPPF